MIILSHPTGNQFNRNAALAMLRGHLLRELNTGIAWDRESWIHKILPLRLQKQLERRSLDRGLLEFTRAHPFREVGRLLAAKINFLKQNERGLFSTDSVFRNFDMKVARRLKHIKPDIKAIFAYEDAALETFKEARRLGLKCIYDLPIGYWRAAREILKEEAVLKPDWASTLWGLKDSEVKLARKDEELSLADLVIVPSNFVKETLKKYPGPDKRIEVIRFGGPAPTAVMKQKNREHKIRLIYVGLLTQRKGISYLFDAFDQLRSEAELTIIGSRPISTCKPLNDNLSKCRWIPSLSNDQILNEMRNHDIMIFPSLFEGFGLVILEAMSQGLPVITTANTGGPDIGIQNGIDGFIVPIRSASAIVEKVKLLCNDRDLLMQMSEKAIKKASVCSWECYQQGILSAVSSVIRQ